MNPPSATAQRKRSRPSAQSARPLGASRRKAARWGRSCVQKEVGAAKKFGNSLLGFRTLFLQLSEPQLKTAPAQSARAARWGITPPFAGRRPHLEAPSFGNCGLLIVSNLHASPQLTL